MPFSGVDCIVPVLYKMYAVCPKWQTHLDIGVGCGQWGYLTRTWFEFADGNFKPETWKRKIIGIEGFEAYRNPTWALYTDVAIGDAYELLKKDPVPADERFDVCTMIEVLEHFDKDKGIEMLKMLRASAHHLFFSYTNSEQGDAFSNEFERHRSQWCDKDILDLFGQAVPVYETAVGKFWYVPPNF